MTLKRPAILILFALSILAAPLLPAQGTASQQNRKSRLEKEIAIIDGQLKANAGKSANALNILTLVQQKIELRKGIIKEGDAEIARLGARIQRTRKTIDSLQVRLDTMSFYYNRLIKGTYKNRDARIWYMYILASDNLAQGLRRYSFLKNLSREMNVQGNKIKESKAALEVQKASLDSMRTVALALQKERMAEMDRLRSEEANAQSTIKVLKKERTKYQNQLNSKKKEVEALKKEMARIVNESVGRASSSKKSGAKKPAAPIDYTLAKEFTSNKGKLPWPAEGPVVETFGAHYHPVYTNLKLPDSDGISIAVPAGTKACAVFDGVVKNVIVQPGYNKCVLVQHGDYFTFYCKLGKVSVKAGDKVKTGQELGTVEPIGGTSQLHFQLWSAKGPQNPVPWLRSR